MPYRSIRNLPDSVRDVLPRRAQEVFLSAFNSIDGPDSKRMRYAWGAVKRAWKKGPDGMWVRKTVFEKSQPTVGDVHVSSTQQKPPIRRRRPLAEILRTLKPATVKSGDVEKKMYRVPEAARNNARRVLQWREEHGDEVRGMTSVGWRRARQLANNSEVSEDTVNAMASFNRHRSNAEVAEEHKGEPWKDAGYVAWLGWGGTTGIDWARGITGAIDKFVDYKSKLQIMDQKRSKMPLAYDPEFMKNIREDQVPRFLGCLTNPELCEEREVRISDLVAIQDRVDTGKVLHLASHPVVGGKLPVVVRMNEKNYIADGHHRVVGAFLRGDDRIKVRFKNLQPKTNAMKGWEVTCPIQKSDGEMQVVYGWASVITDDNGVPVVDRQDDVIGLEDLYKAAHKFMIEARNVGEMHEKVRGIGHVVESLVITPDIRKVMGMPEGPTGWWIGMKIDDPEVWTKVKDGTYSAFSIGGNGTRLSV